MITDKQAKNSLLIIAKEQVANLQITNAKLISEIASVKAQLQELKQIQHKKSFEVVELDKKQNFLMKFFGGAQ